MKVYVSIPITGRDIVAVKEEAEGYKKKYESFGYKVITPFDVCRFQDMAYSACMGKDIEALLECDAIFLAPGWMSSKGCLAEYEVARVYNKTILSKI